jgi:hypothetical protein
VTGQKEEKQAPEPTQSSEPEPGPSEPIIINLPGPSQQKKKDPAAVDPSNIIERGTRRSAKKSKEMSEKLLAPKTQKPKDPAPSRTYRPGFLTPSPPKTPEDLSDEGSEYESQHDSSESDVRQSLEPEGEGDMWDEPEPEESNLVWLCQDGGVKLMDFLISKAIPPVALVAAPTPTNPKEWTFRDIARLPDTEQKEWRTACNEELEALSRWKVFELVERPKGRKVVKNCWVFDKKTDG